MLLKDENIDTITLFINIYIQNNLIILNFFIIINNLIIMSIDQGEDEKMNEEE